jgi:uncharacterized protein
MNELAPNPAMAIAAIYIAILIVGLLPLTLFVIRIRRSKRIGIGDGGNKELAKAVRVHANYVENVPFGLVLLLALAVVDSPLWTIHVLGLGLVVGRTAHALGLSKSTGSSTGRVAGMVLTQTALVFGALVLLWQALA